MSAMNGALVRPYVSPMDRLYVYALTYTYMYFGGLLGLALLDASQHLIHDVTHDTVTHWNTLEHAGTRWNTAAHY